MVSKNKIWKLGGFAWMSVVCGWWLLGKINELFRIQLVKTKYYILCKWIDLWKYEFIRKQYIFIHRGSKCYIPNSTYSVKNEIAAVRTIKLEIIQLL